jgi:purine-binding chemotaxis protein CheW
MASISSRTDESSKAKTVTVSYKGFKDGSVDFLGNQIETMTGYTQQEFNSREVRWTDLILKEDRAASAEIFKRALTGDKTYMREYRVSAKSGNFRWMQEWSHIVCDERGDIEYVTGILIDVTEIKKAEAERLKCEERTGKYLTFALSGQEYGISILRVKEIIELMPTTPVPQVQPYVKGIINLRGKVIPVVDLKLRLDLNGTEFTDRSCIIVVEIKGKDGAALIGTMVDSVSDVVYIRGEDIQDTPVFLDGLGADYILGMARTERSLKPILDIDKILEEINTLGESVRL